MLPHQDKQKKNSENQPIIHVVSYLTLKPFWLNLFTTSLKEKKNELANEPPNY